jgi:hypothetical protein
MNQHSLGNYVSYGGGHTYGFGYSGPRMYKGFSTGQRVGDLCFIDMNGRMVLRFNNLNDPQGIRNLCIAATVPCRRTGTHC